MRFLLIMALALYSQTSFGQNLIFSDTILKAYLLNENSVDLNEDEVADTIIDVNNDNEIQLSEAIGIHNLVISPSTGDTISSIQDLSQFKNLKRLTIPGVHGLKEISNLGLDSLNFIRVNDINDMTNIDLSDMPNLKSIILESLYRLKKLNLQNGTFASEYFSLFYTDIIDVACVDSISAEYDIVADHFLNGNKPSLDCSLGIIEESLDQFEVYPNPVADELKINSSLFNFIVSVYDSNGKKRFEKSNIEKVDFTHFTAGVYLMTFYSSKGVTTLKVIKK